jgi:murein DD-endopeptidase MepM/ murein hydrolase activator NlpD
VGEARHGGGVSVTDRVSQSPTPLAFMVAVSFLLGIVTTITAYFLRAETREAASPPMTVINTTPPTTAPVPAPATITAERTVTREPAAAVPPAPVSPTEAGEIVALRARDLTIPVDDVEAEELHNTFSDWRGTRTHEALDIMSPSGTKVLAVEDGRIEKLFTSKAGGLTIYQFDSTDTFAYYYAHLERYADDLREQQQVRRGDVIGYVGSTGNASPDAPHLHFAIFRLGPDRRWWEGEPINPFLVLARE